MSLTIENPADHNFIDYLRRCRKRLMATTKIISMQALNRIIAEVLQILD
ncbi:MAG: hypothetical protein P8L31_00050 [Pseudomonadales bacterium]|nr:hypothetical protein [Pseudomonadales bacterium]